VDDLDFILDLLERLEVEAFDEPMMRSILSWSTALSFSSSRPPREYMLDPARIDDDVGTGPV
jgi:hypothetical protein